MTSPRRSAKKTPSGKATTTPPGRKPAKKTTRKPAARGPARDQKVLELRSRGKRFDAIAKQLRFRDVAAVQEAYERALDLTLPPAPTDRRQLELQQLRDREDGLWPKADAGSLAAIDELAAIHLERQRLNAAGHVHDHGPRRLGPVEQATVEECDALSKNAPALAAAAIVLARAVDETADADLGPRASAARELRMSMSNLRGLAGLQAPDGRTEEEQAEGGSKPSPQSGKQPAQEKGDDNVVGPSRLQQLRERGDRQ